MSIKKRSVVAMALSGGVDSAVSAALLKQAGHTIIGFFVKTWTPQPGDGTLCTWVDDRRDALRVAARLDIPLHTLDLEADYRSQVIDPFFASYAAGETPNPDVLCNRVIKFGGLWRAAQQLGATKIATGHYAQMHSTSPEILRGRDQAKDQSYFLWDVPVPVLPNILFPIGHYQKAEVRQLAKQFDLPVADKPDSQGICFLGQTDIPTFLATRLEPKTGLLRDWATDTILGHHQGIQSLTIGQRHGLGSLDVHVEGAQFIVKLDAKTNTAWLGPREALLKKNLTVRSANWHDLRLLATLQTDVVAAQVLAQVRYHQKPERARIELIDAGRLAVQFEEPVMAPAPGQSIVFYVDDRLVGGAVIDTIN